MTSTILVLSIGLQFGAAGLAFLLLRKTGRIYAWLFIAAALVLMGGDRLFALVQALSSPARPVDPVAASLALLISLLMLAGLWNIGTLFDRVQRMQSMADDELEKRKLAEAALQSSEQKLRLLTDNMVDAISQIDAERTIVYCSPSVERVYGYKPQDLIGRNAYEKVHPDDALNMRQIALDAIAARRGSVRFEYRYLHASGEYVWVESSIRLLYGENGDYTGAILGSRDVTERKRAEEELREKEENFRQITENMKEVFWLFDWPQQRMLYVSPAYEAVWGRSRDRLYQRYEEWADAIHPDDLTRAREALGQIAETGGGEPFQYRIVRPDGSERWVADVGYAIKDRNGKLLRITGMAEDITERRQTEENLRQANLVIENSPVVLFRWRVEEGWPLAMVSQNVRQFGYTPEELLSGAVPFTAMVHPDDLERMRQEIEEYAAGGVNRYQQTYRIVTRDGRTRWVDDHTVVERGADGQIAYYQGIVIDITERKQAQEALVENSQFVGSLLRAMPVAVFYKDNQGRYLGCNDTFTKIMGVTAEEIKGKTAVDIWPSELAQKYHDMDLELMRSREHQEYEFQVKAKDGRMHPVIFAKDIFLDKNGQLAGLVGAFLDITERKRMEEALRLSEERYAAIIAATNEGVFDWDTAASSAIARVSDRWLDIYGLPGGSAPTKEAWKATVHPEDLARVDQSFEDYLAGKTPIAECEYRVRDRRGVDKWLRGRALAARDPDGRILRVFGTVADITERKRAEESLRFTQFAVDRTADAAFWMTPEARFFYVNQAACQALGYSREELVGMTALDISPDFPRERWSEHWNELREKGHLVFETMHRAKDGRIYPVEITANFVEMDGHEYNCSFARDISERKRIEKSLQREQEFIRALLENMLDGVVACDAEGQLALFNRTAREWHGLDVTEAPQEEWASRYDLFAGDGVTPLTVDKVPLVRAFRGQERLQNVPLVIRAQGQPLRYVTINCVPFCDTEGQLLGAMGVMRDQTEARRAEVALKESEERFRQVVEMAPIPIGIYDTSGRIEYFNPKLVETFGYTVDEVSRVDQWFEKIYTDPDNRQEQVARWQAALKNLGNTPGTAGSGAEVRLTSRDGSERIMQVFDVLMGDRWLGVFHDLTERIRSEEALRASLAEKETLLKEVHHRVKNNLQVISSLLSLQFRQVRSADLRVFLQDTQNRIRSMAMVHEVLYRSGDISNVSFAEYVNSLCGHLGRSFASAGRRIRVTQRIAAVSLDLDQAIVAGLIVNELVTNALKHAFGSRPEGEIAVELQPAGDGRLVLRVSDDGVGLPAPPPEDAGTLGLLLVRNLARQLDGELSVRSGPGSAFEIVFPLRPNGE